jgi:hypothetical protein
MFLDSSYVQKESPSAGQETYSPLWDPNVHNRIHKSRTVVPILKHTPMFHILTQSFFYQF